MTVGPQTAAPVRVGIVGAGFVADFYLRALQSIRGHEVTVLAARSAEKAGAIADRYGIPHTVSTAQQLAERDDVDLVVVALPQDLHVEAVGAAAAAGKGVVCTKPLGRNAAEAARCLDLVTQAGVWHGYAETEVFAPGLVKAKALVDGGAIGRVTRVRAREAHGHPHEHAKDGARSGGGPLRTLGCHCVAIARWFLEGATPVEVFAWGGRITRDDVATEDEALALIRFDDGRIGQVEAGWGHVAGLDVRNEIQGTNGYISTDETGSTGIHAFAGASAGYVLEKAGADTGWMTPVADEPWTYGYRDEFAHFIESFAAGRPPRQTLHDGVIDNAVVDAAYASMRSGTWETIAIPAAALQR